jgi:hypothetical protein
LKYCRKWCNNTYNKHSLNNFLSIWLFLCLRMEIYRCNWWNYYYKISYWYFQFLRITYRFWKTSRYINKKYNIAGIYNMLSNCLFIVINFINIWQNYSYYKFTYGVISLTTNDFIRFTSNTRRVIYWENCLKSVYYKYYCIIFCSTSIIILIRCIKR